MSNVDNNNLVVKGTISTEKMLIPMMGVGYIILILNGKYLGSNIFLLLLLLGISNLFMNPSHIEIDFCNGTVKKHYRSLCGLARKTKTYLIYEYKSVRSYIQSGRRGLNVVELVSNTNNNLELIELNPVTEAKSFFSVPMPVECNDSKRIREAISSNFPVKDDGFQGYSSIF